VHKARGPSIKRVRYSDIGNITTRKAVTILALPASSLRAAILSLGIVVSNEVAHSSVRFRMQVQTAVMKPPIVRLGSATVGKETQACLTDAPLTYRAAGAYLSHAREDRYESSG